MNYIKIIEGYQDDMIRMLQELISIKSVITDPAGDAPFGAGIQKAFDYMLQKGTEEGFSVVNIDNYGGHIDFVDPGIDQNDSKSKQEIMAIMGHLDVVPEGTDWDYDPYGGELIDGKVYGRGAIDDKGPVVAAFYAMKSLKEAGLIPKKKVRLILGLDEETNWKGMDYYLKRVEMPDFGFTPDCNFPAVHGEMGVLVFDLTKQFKNITSVKSEGILVTQLSGGNAPNTVADKAQAVLITDNDAEIEDLLNAYIAESGHQLELKKQSGQIEINAMGISSHGARPAMGLNAISILMQFLSKLDLQNEELGSFIQFYNKHIGFELNGRSLGCGFSDQQSGDLILNVGILRADQNGVSLTINIRYPVTSDEEKVYHAISPALSIYDLEIVKKKHQAPIYLPVEDPMVGKLIDIYRRHSGDLQSKPTVTGCTTYARAIKNTIAFGAVFPGDPELAHQKNEYIEVDKLMKLSKIFADSIYEMTIDIN